MTNLTDRDRRFNNDLILNQINQKFVSLQDEDRKNHSAHLAKVLGAFILKMRATNPLFNACFQEISYVGSFYEGLKVGKPVEFDLNIIIDIPINYKNDLTVSIAPEAAGYIKIQAGPDVLITLEKKPRWKQEYSEMEKWFSAKRYLDQNKFRQWFESVVSKVLNSLDTSGPNRYILETDEVLYKISVRKSGPAFTLIIKIPEIQENVDVDLVPVLAFILPLPKPFRAIPTEKSTYWFAVSKPLLKVQLDNLLWRPSFYKWELEILKGNIKQVVRQMKKFRDSQNLVRIASYYIKTLFLWELEKQKDPEKHYEAIDSAEFQKIPTTNLFFNMLKVMRDAFQNGKIENFWYPKQNLLTGFSAAEMQNIAGKISNIIRTIEKKIESDPYIIAQYILTPIELTDLKQEDCKKITMTPIELKNLKQEEKEDCQTITNTENQVEDCLLSVKNLGIAAACGTAAVIVSDQLRSNRTPAPRVQERLAIFTAGAATSMLFNYFFSNVDNNHESNEIVDGLTDNGPL